MPAHAPAARPFLLHGLRCLGRCRADSASAKENQVSISAKTRKMLWGRAASRCSFPDCPIELTMDVGGAGKLTVVGEECHIVAQELDGPRGRSPLTPEERDEYANLVLMCSVHHKVIDDNEQKYTVEVIGTLKDTHEEWVRTRLAGFDGARQNDEEVYAAYVEEWERRADLSHWNTWTSGLLSHGQPMLSASRFSELVDLGSWLFARIWPGRHADLEAAFETFRRVLSDLLNTLQEHGHRIGADDDQYVQVEKVYQRLERWDPPAYERLSRRFEFAVSLVEDLCLELTRAANLVCDQVRAVLVPGFRLADGLLVVTSGPHMDLSWRTYRPRYAAGTAPAKAYGGLDHFLRERSSRDTHFGSGTLQEAEAGAGAPDDDT